MQFLTTLSAFVALAALVSAAYYRRNYQALEAKTIMDKAALDTAIGRVVTSTSNEIKRVTDALAAKSTDTVDLTPEIAQLNGLADQLDAAVPDPSSTTTDAGTEPTPTTPAP